MVNEFNLTLFRILGILRLKQFVHMGMKNLKDNNLF